MKIQLILLFLFAFVATSWGQKEQKKAGPATITIQTNAECMQCKNRIEKELNFTKGVIAADLNLETKAITIEYNWKKTDVVTLQKVITELGYDADDQKANTDAQKKLPSCCQPGGM